ncbi:two-partner secretion domain-containing protein [Trichothermofontia sp.]
MKYLLPLVIVFPIAGTLFLGVAVAQPIVPAADGTGTIVRPVGERFEIEGGKTSRDGANLFHSFQRFNLSKQQIANFLASPQLRNILGRIVGGDASYIDGLIQISGGNPNLFLLNPAGIMFGPNAALNVPADFTAVTATGIGFNQGWLTAIGSPDYAQLVGTPNQFTFATAHPGAIVQAGNLTVPPGHNLRLIGGTVINTGNLSAPGGEVTIAAVPGANLIRLSQPGHLLSLEMTPLTAQNAGLATPSLPELLTGGNVSGATGLAVMPDGRVQLQGSGVVVPTESGTAIVTGQVNAASTQAPGGNVNLFGEHVGLLGAELNASGTRGGTVRIGGDYQGLGAVPNANATYTDTNTHIRADALTKGDGGQVIVWADDTTRFYGRISAQGGPAGGDGGLVETSGKLGLDVADARVDASAPQGQPGTWLLDPSDITITAGPTNPPNPGPNFNPSGATANINAQQISDTLSQGTSVLITTAGGTGGQGNITVSAPIFKTAVFNASNQIVAGGAATLSLSADNNITINSSIRSDYNPLNVRLSAPSGVVTINGLIATNGGDFTSRSVNFTAGTIDTSPVFFVVPPVPPPFPPPPVPPPPPPPPGFTVTDAGNIDIEVGLGNIVAGSLRAEGVSEGAGGNVNLRAARGTVRILDTIVATPSSCLGNSICTTGSPAGTVSITHGGGPENYDFVVGDATNNGTAGAIVATGTLSPTTVFPMLPAGGAAPGTPNGMTITSINSPPILTATFTITGPIENQTYAFPVLALELSAFDPDGDRLSSDGVVFLPDSGFLITSVETGGTLQVQRGGGIPFDVVPGETRILLNDTLLYTPPPDTVGLEPGFTIAVQEVRNASFSPPLNTVERPVPLPLVQRPV